ncbi:hypothetical protein [Zavarzinella formosa]|uniref:hypothetical protein n=1 Tax=Zavarzinella formosa TaxID=360055 RepID=UPI0002FD4B0B|nr:hypothetical protein [Zavarzinella formosa]
MAIKNITDEIEQLRGEKVLHGRIDGLGQEKAAFILKALMLAGHVSEHVMIQSLDLADTIRWACKESCVRGVERVLPILFL